MSVAISPKQVVYCAVCSFPPEYCEFSGRVSKCKEWLQENNPQLFNVLYSDDALEDKMASLTIEQRQALEKELAKKEMKEEKKIEKEKAKIASSKIILKRIERNKRKHITEIHGLDVFGIDLKAATKFFANKFATGSSINKNNQGEEEIVIQGDVCNEVEEILTEKSNKKIVAIFGGNISSDQIEIVEDKKKKKGAEAAVV